jgi:hypothetical protein
VSFGVVETDAGVCACAPSATHDVRTRTTEPERVLSDTIPVGMK